MNAHPLPMEIGTIAQLAEMKRIYSAMETSLPASGPVCVLVTSAERREGKTTAAAGLAALAASRSGRRALAVDLNWHAPALHRCFGLDLADGTRLGDGASALESVKPTGLADLELLTAFASVPDGTDENAVGTHIMRQARSAYDLVFVDASSVFPTNRRMMDPIAISKAADGVVLVVLAGVTPRQRVRKAQMMLHTAGSKLLGVIVNQWRNPLL